MPISSTAGVIIGDISDEEGWRHWTTTGHSGWVSSCWLLASVVVGISINSSLRVFSIPACRTKLQIISEDTSWVGGWRGEWVVGNFRSIKIVDDLSDTKTHRKFISVEKGQIVVINLVGKQHFVFVKDGRSTIGRSRVLSLSVGIT